MYLEFIDRIKKIYEVYKEKKKMKDVEERKEKKERDDDEYGTFDVGARLGDPEYDEALDKYRKYYKGEDIKAMMKAYFDNNGFGWDGKAPNEILGQYNYEKALIDITKHTKDNIDEEFNYHYFDGEWVEITTEESIKKIVWVIENTQNNINRFASSKLPERIKDSLTIGFDKMIETMTQDGEMTGGFWIVEWDKEREKDDTYNHFHLSWTDYDTEPLNVIRFVELHGPLHSASESEISEVESTDVESLGSNPEGTIGGGRLRKKKTRKKRKRRKRGGMEEQPTPPQAPRDNDVGTNQYEPGQLGVQQPPPLPQFMLPPPANHEPVRRNRALTIDMERAPPGMRRPDDVVANDVNRANRRYRRSQRSYLRNLTGDLLERCTGSRCGLGGRRRKKTRKKKNRKRRTKKKSRKHKRRK